MRPTMPLVIASLLTLLTAGPLFGQITSNPISAPIEKRGLAVEIRDLVRLPLKKADDGIPQTVAPIEEIQLYTRDASGTRTNVTLQELINRTMSASISRADLHIGRSRDGEIFVTSRQDGMIRMLVPDEGGAGTASRSR